MVSFFVYYLNVSIGTVEKTKGERRRRREER
jgi:hypothetical protein